MSRYIDSLNEEIKKYFNILCNNDYPYYIDKYIELKELKRLSYIGQFCGCDYTKIHKVKYWYSRLDHSIACALMAWNFTKDKAQTLLALFHDLGTPAFSHCIDHLLKDTENQESSERDVYEIINESVDIKKYLIEDNIDIKDLSNIEKYTILENKKPKLCVDRLDGILHTCLIWLNCWNICKIKKVYEDMKVLTNEFGEDEIGFIDKNICDIFFEGIFEYSIALQKNEDKYTMQLIADILEELIKKNKLSIDELYIKSEKEIIELIEGNYSKQWNKFKNTTELKRSEVKPEDVYYVSIECKKRYVIPVCKCDGKTYRLNELSDKCKRLLDEYLSYKDSKYSYIDEIII